MRFDELGLDADILRSLEAMNFEEMTPVQEHTIPIILENKDLIGCAQTGTGKTAAYTLPLLDKLLREGNPDNVVKSLIVVPHARTGPTDRRTVPGIILTSLPLSTTGGLRRRRRHRLGTAEAGHAAGLGHRRGDAGTPAGPHRQQRNRPLARELFRAPDEADRMLDLGFFDDIMKIIKELPTERQTIMFSATLPPENPADGQTNPAQSGRSEHRRIETQ